MRQKLHRVEIIFPLALLCVFAICAVSSVLVGAQVYRRTAANMEESFRTRTTLVYLWERVKQGDEAGALSLRELPGEAATALVLTQQLETGIYETWIYPHEGTLRELMIPAGRAFQPQDGTLILEVEGLSIGSTPEGLIRFAISPAGGDSSELLVSPRSGLGGADPS